MVYSLGRDVSIYIGTEAVTADKHIGALYASGSGTASCTVNASDTSNMTVFAQSLEIGTARGTNWTAQSDITGVDVSIGATDEDITYIGQKGTGKVEVKNEYTVSLTRKKKDNSWDTIFNGPTLAGDAEDGAGLHGTRWGLAGDYGNSTAEAELVADGMANPKDYATSEGEVEAGYRIFVVLKAGAAGETMAFPNCLITSHSVSLNADGTSEETMEFMTQQRALQGTTGDTFNVTQTTTGIY